jgi:uncharacterized protein YdeI (YjbR/CyaY-like superfamily)
MRPAGAAAFARRSEARTGVYSHEQGKTVELGDELEAIFRANPTAWAFFEAQPAWYRRTAAWWVVSAKRDDTRRKRLATLIEASASGQTLHQLDRRPTGKQPA